MRQKSFLSSATVEVLQNYFDLVAWSILHQEKIHLNDPFVIAISES